MRNHRLIGLLYTCTLVCVLAHPYVASGQWNLWSEKSLSVVSEELPQKREALVEVVFVLDTTSSMSGLIDAAKQNIWAIATNLAKGAPAPRLRIGLVAYRDRGDIYETKVFDLTEDMDQIYASLMELNAAGGGDGPESVNRALAASLQQIHWSSPAGVQGEPVYQTVFLIGDAPPHMDYANEVRYPEILRWATAKGIVVNTLQAGNDPVTRQFWQEIAALSQGQYLQVSHNVHRVRTSTPFDAELARLGRSLESARLYFGAPEVIEELDRKAAVSNRIKEHSPTADLAKRAEFNLTAAGKINAHGNRDLIEMIDARAMKLEDVAEEELPAALRLVKPSARERLVVERIRERRKLEQQIELLARERRQYLEQKLAPETREATLNNQLHQVIKQQAGKRGLHYHEELVL